MSKRKFKCDHLQTCQQCQDALDAAVDDMLEDVLGPALEEVALGSDEDEGSEDLAEDEENGEDSHQSESSQCQPQSGQSSSDTSAQQLRRGSRSSRGQPTRKGSTHSTTFTGS